MTEKNCIVIDDDDQKEIFESTVQTPLRKQGFDVHAIYIKTTNSEFLGTSGDLDINKVRIKLEEAFKNKSIDVIATDFGLSDDKINGINIIEEIRKLRPQTPIILYSGKLDDVIEYTLGDYAHKNQKDLIHGIKKMMSFGIKDYVERSNYGDVVISILKNKKNQTSSLLIQKIREYGDMEFKSCYKPFKGLKLNDIADEVERQSPQGRDFQEEIIEQTIAYLISLNKA